MTVGRRSLILSLVLLIGACGAYAPGFADRGIGGTGISVGDRGIGGTGIVGTVTAFGSVWVNGLRVDLPTSTAVRVEGVPADPSAVRVGHLVALTAASGGPTGLEARTLDVRYAVAGPVERLDGATAIVLGQRVEAAPGVGRKPLRPGSWVAVSGLRRPDGVIAAGRVDGWDETKGWLLRGRLDAVGPSTLTVSGLTLSRGGLDAAVPPVGSAVRASGRVAAGSLALSVTPDPFNPFGAAVGALSVEAFVDAAGRPSGLDAPVPGAAPGRRVVIDSVVGSGGGIGGSRAFGAPSIGRTAAPGAEADRAAGLAREGSRRDGAQGAQGGPPGFGAPDASGPADAARGEGQRGEGQKGEGPRGDASRGDGPPGAGRSPDGMGREGNGPDSGRNGMGGPSGGGRGGMGGPPGGGLGGGPGGGPGRGPPGGGPPGGGRGGPGGRGGDGAR
ncbi:DUF5666 domain-containing protein [Azospirillum doebereinerae]